MKTGNLKNVFTVQKYTAPNFQNFQKKKKKKRNLWDFLSFKQIVKLLLSTCLHFKTGFKTCLKRFIGKIYLFVPSLGEKEVIIP